MPAAAVIRGEQALYSQTGRKGFCGGKLFVEDVTSKSNLEISSIQIFWNVMGVYVSPSRELKFVDGWPRSIGEGRIPYYIDA